MSNINVSIIEAVVTAVHEFNCLKGYGVDYFVEVQSSNSTVYLQIVVYDNDARSYCQYIHEGDSINVTGDLKVKVYKKKDGTDGIALIIERPVSFSKIDHSKDKPQSLQDLYNSKTLNIVQATDAVTANEDTASADTAEDDFWDIVSSENKKDRR